MCLYRLGARDDTLIGSRVEAASSYVLDKEDYEILNAVVDEMPGLPGDVYGIERDRNGPSGMLMQYDRVAGPEHLEECVNR